VGHVVDACNLVLDWSLDPGFAEKIALVINRTEAEIGRPVRVISGFRTREKQQELINQPGVLAAPLDVSNHTLCPAHAVDVSLGAFPTRVQKALWGANLLFGGLRWGGGGPVDSGGIPIDWQHADDGPRGQFGL